MLPQHDIDWQSERGGSKRQFKVEIVLKEAIHYGSVNGRIGGRNNPGPYKGGWWIERAEENL